MQAAKAADRPVPSAILVDGVRVPFVAVQLTYGRRYYFVAPCCGRRVEALYFLGREVGCRKCLHLGYKSQMSRPASVWRFLDKTFDRHSLWKRIFRRYEEDDNPVVAGAVEPVRRLLAERIEAMMDRVEVVDNGEDE